jgi:hypothetical protein
MHTQGTININAIAVAGDELQLVIRGSRACQYQKINLIFLGVGIRFQSLQISDSLQALDLFIG